MRRRSLLLSPLAVWPLAAAAGPRLELNGPAHPRPPWLAKLQSLQQGRAEVFRVLQVGDSHTAGDYFTGQLRALLQRRWGNAGAGWVWPAAVAHQRAAAVQYAGSGWRVMTARDAVKEGDLPLDLPLGGVLARSLPSHAGGHLQITPAAAYAGPQRVTALARPARAQKPLTFSDTRGPVHAEEPAPAAGWRVITFEAEPPLRITAQAGDVWDAGPIGFESGRVGITVSALGLNGAQITHAERWRSGWPQDLQATRADLLILAFGTNEAFTHRPDPARAEAAWRHVLDAAARALPRAGVLVLGPPDVLSAAPGAAATPADCPRPLWLGLNQRMQRRVAQAHQAAWWPWHEAMQETSAEGNDCPPRRWQAAGWMAADGVHLTPTGYARAARLLADELIRLALQPVDSQGVATNSIATNPLNESASCYQKMSMVGLRDTKKARNGQNRCALS